MRKLIAALCLIVAGLFAAPALAQQLTPAQQSTLRTFSASDPTAAQLMATADDVGLAAWLNAPTSYIIWHPTVTPEQWDAAMMAGITQMDGLTVGKRDTLFVVMSRTRDCRDASVRASIDDLTGTQNTLKGALQAACKRPATRAEQALSTGTGTTAAPGVAAWVGALSYADASHIRSAP